MRNSMKTIAFTVTAALSLAGVGLAAQSPKQASKATVALYQAQCAACHGPDGSAQVPAGKALGARDFHSSGVQNETDDTLIGVVANGKAKMPAYGKKLSAADIKSVVAYIRQLGGQK